MDIILNNILPWDGSQLEDSALVLDAWNIPPYKYWTLQTKHGLIYCTYQILQNKFCLFIEEALSLWHLPRRGSHIVIINNCEYLIHYVPYDDIQGEIIWETPLSKVSLSSPIRKSIGFANQMRDLIVFCEIFGLQKTSEVSIIVRTTIPHPRAQEFGLLYQWSPIIINEYNSHDFSDRVTKVVPVTFFRRWFPEQFDKSTTLNDILHYDEAKPLNVFLSEWKTELDKLYTKYHLSHIWYTFNIIERMARHLRLLGRPN